MKATSAKTIRVGRQWTRVLSAAGLVTLITLLAQPVCAGAWAPYWSNLYGEFGGDVGMSVVVDGAGNVIVTGRFEGTINFGGSDLTSAGDEDIFVVKFSQYGIHQWSKRFGSIGDDQGIDVAVDAAGSIYLTGYFEDTVELGGASLISAGGRDIFVAKFGFDGTHIWSFSYGSSFGNDEGHSVAVDGSGDVVVAGEFGNTLNYGGFNLVSNGGTDIFLAKYDSFGNLDWAQSFGGTDFDSMSEVAAAQSSDDIYITGNFRNSIDLGGGALVSAGMDDIFLARYSPGGGHQWSYRFGDTALDYGTGLAVDAAGNVFVTGAFDGTVNFGGGNHISAGSSMFLVSYNNGGSHRWSLSAGSGCHGWDVTVSSAQDVFVTGLLLGTADFGGGDLSSAGAADVFMVRYDNDGNHQRSDLYGDMGTDVAFGIAVDANEHPIITGETNGTINFGGGDLTTTGAFDVFVAKFFGQIEIGQLDDCPNDRGLCALMVFEKHFLDGPPNPLLPAITHYSVWRAVGGLPMYPPDPVCPGIGAAAADASRATSLDPCEFWERVAVVIADAPEVPYQVEVPTSEDGTMSYFIVLAENDQGGWYTSPPESVSTTNQLGSTILSVSDVPNDQGRWVSIAFTKDSEDAEGASTQVLSYGVYRRDDPAPSSSAAEAISGDSEDALLKIEGWTFVASAPAHGESIYLVEAPTVGDSTIAGGDYNSTFFVRAMTAAPTIFFDSPSAAGYSLDNLAPPAPTGAAYSAGNLSWDPLPAADFDYFTVYGNVINDFGSAVLVGYTTGESMDVSGSPYPWYFTTATDFSGNEGPPSTPAIATGIGGRPERYVLSVSSYPNPFNPSTTVKYTVPAQGDVTVAIYDARGARVATLVAGQPHAAGAYTVAWNARSSRGAAVTSGIYFARIEHASGTRSKKLILLK